MAESTDKTLETLVEVGTKLRGSVESDCKVVVRGQIDGDVQSPSLFVSEGGKVAGTIVANEIESRGTISGEVEASRVLLSGNVLDDSVIRSEFLEIKASATPVVFGTCELEVGEAPSKEARLAAARDRQAETAPAAQAEPVAQVQEPEAVAKVDEAKADEAKADEAKADEAKADEAKADEAKADEAKADADDGAAAKGEGRGNKKKRARTDSNWGEVSASRKGKRRPTDTPPTA